jgi:hypothetical protein
MPRLYQECGLLLGDRLVIAHDPAGTVWKRVPYTCSKPAKFEGADGVMRCVQHDRMSRGLSGKWTREAR